MAWWIDFWSLENKIYIMKLLKSFWKVEMEILGHLDWILRSYEEILLNLTWQPTVDWSIDVPTPVYIYVVHRTYVNSWLRCFIDIELLPSTIWDICMGWKILDLRYLFYDMWMHGCTNFFGIIINERIWVLP